MAYNVVFALLGLKTVHETHNVGFAPVSGRCGRLRVFSERLALAAADG